MIIAPINATIQRIRVAELAVSFAILAKGRYCVVIRSTTASIAELIASHAAIAPHIKIIKSHS